MELRTRSDLRRTSLRLFGAFWLIASVLVLAAPQLLFGQEPGKGSPPYPQVEPREGETCIVCDETVAAADRVYEVEGHRVPVHVGACDIAFLRAPEHFLARFKPRGAFLGAEPNLGPNFSWGWFAFGIYVVVGLVFGALCAYRAVNHSLNPLRWFLAGFFLNIFGYLALATRRPGDGGISSIGLHRGLVKIPTTHRPWVCPKCGTTSHPSATSCAGCGNKIDPLVISEVTKVGLRVKVGSKR